VKLETRNDAEKIFFCDGLQLFEHSTTYGEAFGAQRMVEHFGYGDFVRIAEIQN